MKNTLQKRIEYLFADLGINQMDFSQRTGFGQSYISQILNGSKTNPSPRFFDKVCREFNVSPQWLLDGNGDVYVLPDNIGGNGDAGSFAAGAEILAKYRLLPQTEQRIIEDMINALLVKADAGEEKKAARKVRRSSPRKTRKK